MRYLMLLLNCVALILGSANIIYSSLMFRRRYLYALSIMTEKDTAPNFGYDPYREGLKILGINFLIAIAGTIASLCDGLPTENQQKPIVAPIVVFFLVFLTGIIVGVIFEIKTTKFNSFYIIPDCVEREECLYKMTRTAQGFFNFTSSIALLLSFQAMTVVYGFILCFF